MWIVFIVQYSSEKILSIFIFTASIGIYFFLSFKNNLRLYICLISLVLLHDLVIDSAENLYLILLILNIAILGAFRLAKEKFIKLSVISVLYLSYLCFAINHFQIEIILLLAFLYFLLFQLNHSKQTNGTRKKLYDELVHEYRQLKRIHVSAEQNIKIMERTRIARDLHDSVGHQLTALIIKLEMLAIQKQDETYRDLKKMALESLEETREAVKALQVQDEEGIAAVVQLIRKLETESNLHIAFTLQQGILSVVLSNTVSVVLYRMIQEALTNAMRHSEKRLIKIIIGKTAIGDIEFCITNEMIEQRRFEYGFGLKNMKQRAEEIGGRLEVQQTDGLFIVRGILPVK